MHRWVAVAVVLLSTQFAFAQSAAMPLPVAVVKDADGKVMAQIVDLGSAANPEDMYPRILLDVEGGPAWFMVKPVEGLLTSGKTIYFSSDRDEHKVYNIYALDLETGTIEQYTDVTGGCFSPVELGERGDEQQLLFTAYYQGAFSLYRMPLKEPEATIEAIDRAREPGDARDVPDELRQVVKGDWRDEPAANCHTIWSAILTVRSASILV